MRGDIDLENVPEANVPPVWQKKVIRKLNFFEVPTSN